MCDVLLLKNRTDVLKASQERGRIMGKESVHNSAEGEILLLSGKSIKQQLIDEIMSLTEEELMLIHSLLTASQIL